MYLCCPGRWDSAHTMNLHMTVSLVKLLISKGIACYIIVAAVEKIPNANFLRVSSCHQKQDYFVKI